MITDITIFSGPINRHDFNLIKTEFDMLGVAIIFDNSSLVLSASLSSEGDDFPLGGSFVFELSSKNEDVVTSFKNLLSLHDLPYISETITSLYDMFPELGNPVGGYDLALSILNGRRVAMSIPHTNGLVEIRYDRPLSLTMSVASNSTI